MYSLPEQDHVLQVKPHPFGWLMSHLCSSSCLHPQPPPLQETAGLCPQGRTPVMWGPESMLESRNTTLLCFPASPVPMLSWIRAQ